MTNREWMQSMEIDRLAEFISGFEYCNYCQACDYKRVECKKAIKTWLEAEHIETQVVKDLKNCGGEEMTEKDFWEALGDACEASDIPCSLCPAFIYNGGCVNECKESCKKSLETVYKKIVNVNT